MFNVSFFSIFFFFILVATVAHHLPGVYVDKLLEFLAAKLERTTHLQFYLTWSKHLMYSHGPSLKLRSGKVMPALRALQKSVTVKSKDIGNM